MWSVGAWSLMLKKTGKEYTDRFLLKILYQLIKILSNPCFTVNNSARD